MLQVNNLTVRLGENTLVNNISFKLDSNQCLGIVGESGSGKSLTSYAINGLLGEEFKVNGSVMFEGKNLLDLTVKERQLMRGRKIAMIMQSPMTAFNPLFTIGNQVAETLCSHLHCSKKEALSIINETCQRINLQNTNALLAKYPHELSGGMLQRIMIAITVALKPDLIIADEPTTAIDYISQKEVIGELQKIRDLYKTSIIFISHDLSLVSRMADHLVVMNKGEIVEQGATKDIFLHSNHDYTRYLINTRLKLINRFSQIMSHQHAD